MMCQMFNRAKVNYKTTAWQNLDESIIEAFYPTGMIVYEFKNNQLQNVEFWAEEN